MDGLLAFLGGLAGAAIGALAGMTIERLRGRHELALVRRADIKDALLACHRASRELVQWVDGLYIFGQQEVNPPTYVAISDERKAMTTHFYDVEVLLPSESPMRQRLNEMHYALNMYLAAPTHSGEPRALKNEKRYQAVKDAQKALQNAIRDELQRL